MKSIESDLRDQSETSNVFLMFFFFKGLLYFTSDSVRKTWQLAIANTNGVFCQEKFQKKVR